ncbi:MAG: hypothetical protein AAGK09_10585 [Planctomycetota bacterium]
MAEFLTTDSGFVASDGVVEAHVPCVVCGASLRGRAATGTCNACGAPVRQTLDRVDPVFALDDDGRLAESVACRDCDYDLRGLLPDEPCPECGTGVTASMRSDLLGHMNRAWLKRVRSGLLLMFASMALGIVGGVLFAMLSAFMFASGGPGGAGMMSWVSMAAVVGQTVVLGFIWLLGVYRFTAAEPGGLRAGYERVVKAARLGEVARYAVAIGTALLTAGMMYGVVIGSGSGLVIGQSLLAVIAGVAGVVSFAGLFLYGARLFDRVPSQRLMRQAKRVAWGYVVVGVIATGGQLAQTVYFQLVLNPSAMSGAGASSQAVQAQAGQTVAGGTTNTSQHANPDGTQVAITTTTYPDGSVWTHTETTDASGNVVSTSSNVMSSTAGFGGPGGGFAWPFFVIQGVMILGGFGVIFFVIWGLVLAILLYRKLNAAIGNPMARDVTGALGGRGVPA